MEAKKGGLMGNLLQRTVVCLVLNVLLCSGADGLKLGKSVQRANGVCATFVIPWGYGCDEFMVETDDGFLLGLQKITSPKSSGKSKGPAFLYHGILIGGDSWLLNPPEESLPFMLADTGYDVWIGNTRTTSFSFNHVSLRREEKSFWDWSVDELWQYDLAAMLEFVHSKSQSKISYIGFSQGTQAAFAAFSEGKLIDMVKNVVMLAPVAYVDHATSPIPIAAVKLYVDKIVENLPLYAFDTQIISGKALIEFICTSSNLPCIEGLTTLVTGPNCCINESRRAWYDKYEAQATSAKNLFHLVQQYRAKTFAKYDYGAKENLQRYGQKTPPSYDMSKIPKDIHLMLIQAEKDAIAVPSDIKHLLNELKSKPTFVSIPTYAHLDFVVATNANRLVYDKVLDFLGQPT
ncbi:hypothetical protein O6H91_08G103800 [Diphasiastrum complanatum]|nr:hypothetical protein O6H91_08G103800 [Diphasiastrum complanatum]